MKTIGTLIVYPAINNQSAEGPSNSPQFLRAQQVAPPPRNLQPSDPKEIELEDASSALKRLQNSTFELNEGQKKAIEDTFYLYPRDWEKIRAIVDPSAKVPVSAVRLYFREKCKVKPAYLAFELKDAEVSRKLRNVRSTIARSLFLSDPHYHNTAGLCCSVGCKVHGRRLDIGGKPIVGCGGCTNAAHRGANCSGTVSKGAWFCQACLAPTSNTQDAAAATVALEQLYTVQMPQVQGQTEEHEKRRAEKARAMILQRFKERGGKADLLID